MKSTFITFLLFSLIACSELPLISNQGYIITENSRIKSWRDLKQDNVIMQAYDYSCGAASLATLMRHYFNEDIDEIKLLKEISNMFSDEEMNIIKELGLSFLELETIAKNKGYQAISLQLTLSALADLSGPVLVYITPDDYKHFAVLRGVIKDKVFLADPSRGNIILSLKDFAKDWQGETFIMGRVDFTTEANHGLAIHNATRLYKSVLTERKPLQNSIMLELGEK